MWCPSHQTLASSQNIPLSFQNCNGREGGHRELEGEKLSTPKHIRVRRGDTGGGFPHVHSLTQEPCLRVTVAYPKPQKTYFLKPIFQEIQLDGGYSQVYLIHKTSSMYNSREYVSKTFWVCSSSQMHVMYLLFTWGLMITWNPDDIWFCSVSSGQLESPLGIINLLSISWKIKTVLSLLWHLLAL